MKNKNIILFLAVLSFAVVLFGDSASLFLDATARYDQRVEVGKATTRLIGEFGQQLNFTTGVSTTTEELDTIFSTTATVGTSSPDIYDLQAIQNFQGASVSFRLVKVFGVRNLSTTDELIVGGDSWLKTSTLGISGMRLEVSPMTGLAVATGACSITISTATDTCQYEIFLSGIKN